MTHYCESHVSRAFGACLVLGLLLGRPANAATCAAPDDASQCTTLCSTPSDCIACCTAADAQAAACRRACVHVRAPRPSRASRPTRPSHSGAPASANLTASCSLLQVGDRVAVTLLVQNPSRATITNVVPGSPSLQVDANTDFVLDATPRPPAYVTVRAGRVATFTWDGSLNSAGAVGISVSASATDANRGTINTALVDCGTATRTQRSRRPVATRPGPHQSSPTVQSEATQCAACHENPKQAFIAEKWAQSAHANSYGADQGNTFCARCHSPFQADQTATASNSKPIAVGQWQGVTCSVCHPPQDKMSQWETPIALYDVATRAYTPVALADANLLCLNCHNGTHAPGIGTAGLRMLQSGVRCIDCHMADIASGNRSVGEAPAHDFKVAANLPNSCGLVAGGCHASGTQEWALGEIRSGAIHGGQ